MFTNWLHSTRHIERPAGMDVEFVVVENGSRKTLNEVIQAERNRPADERVIHYVLEPKLGISNARNAAVDKALSIDATYIVFVDDDEILTRDWVSILVQDCMAQGALLLGGPVRPLIDRTGLGRYHKALATGIAKRYYTVEKLNGERFRRGRISQITIVTNNWIGHRSLFDEHGLRFSEALGFSGGEDTRFFRDALEKGVKTGWSERAFVYETVPRERISLRHQYLRHKSQALAHLRDKRRRYKGSAAWFTISALSITAVRALTAICIQLPMVPLTGGSSAVAVARNLGWCHGRILEFLGGNADYYRHTTGD